jgi:two-component system, cell cycle sensor histidine kinase and response regulator CckA
MTTTPFEHIVAVMPDAVVVTDQDGIVRFANAAANRLFGKRDGELAGRSAPFSPTASGASEIEVGDERRIADIRVAACEWNGRPAMLAIIRDITEQKRSSEHHHQALKMEAIGSLAGGIAHDFNNLLLVMLIYAEMIRGECTKDDSRSADIMEVIRAVERAQALTRQLLAFSGKRTGEPAAIRLDEVVAGLHGALRGALPANVEIVTHFAGQSWLVLADQSQIEQAIMNLALNAADSMPDGGRFVLEVRNRSVPRTDRPDLHDHHVEVCAMDDGRGIEPQHLNRIFEPFFTRERGHAGGLGLATCHGIVAQAGGKIAVESERGKGTKFTILLPRARDDAAEKPARPQEASPRATMETVLLVEDDAAVMRATANILRTNGYTVVTAMNGEEACRVLQDQSEKINLVLSDIVMPQLSGLELEKIVAERWPQLPLVLMTGYSEQPVVHQDDGIRIESRPALMKPFRAGALLRVVRNVLDHQLDRKPVHGKPTHVAEPPP